MRETPAIFTFAFRPLCRTHQPISTMPGYKVAALTILSLLAVVALAYSAPTPGGGGHHHTIVRVHVPYKVHHVHHHHVKKVPVYIKEYKAKHHHHELEEEEFDDREDEHHFDGDEGEIEERED